MVELTEDGRRVVEALLAAAVAWQSPAELASATGRDVGETTDVVALLDVGGWLEAWERPGDVVVTLSVAAASCLEVRIVESGPGQTPRWARRGELEPPSPRASGVFRGERAARLERVIDTRPTAEQAAERAEEALIRSAIPADIRVPAVIDGLPAPTHLVGTGLSPWPGPGQGHKASCPCCQSRRLGPSTYCLYCDRWGLDHLLRAEPPDRPPARRPGAEEGRRRDRERRAREEKRRRRRSDQVEAERRVKAARRLARP